MDGSGINVLISSVSKKVPLVKAVRKAVEKIGMGGSIIGADTNSGCIGSYFVDQFWNMPRIEEITPEELIAFCHSHHVNCVIPTRDGELLFFAQNKDLFAEKGIHVMISGKEQIAVCFDKLNFYQTTSSLGYSAIETALSLEELESETFVVKERYGAGSRNIGLDLSKTYAAKHSKKIGEAIYQPFIRGNEISIDLYVDKSGKTKGAIARHRDLIVEGESQITTSFQNDVIVTLCAEVAEKLALYGHVIFQIIISGENGVQYLMECNPRFGGASPLSLEMGLDSFYWFFLEVLDKDLDDFPFIRSDEEKRLIRHPEDLIISWNTVA